MPRHTPDKNKACSCCYSYYDPPKCLINCSDVSISLRIIEKIEWEVSIPSPLDWWYATPKSPAPVELRNWRRLRGTGLSVFNGTYVLTPVANRCYPSIREQQPVNYELTWFGKEVPPGLPNGCGDGCPTILEGYDSKNCVATTTIVCTRTTCAVGAGDVNSGNECPCVPFEQLCATPGGFNCPGFRVDIEENYCQEQTFVLPFPRIWLANNIDSDECDLFVKNEVTITYRPFVDPPLP